jgi:hypothetical protein
MQKYKICENCYNKREYGCSKMVTPNKRRGNDCVFLSSPHPPLVVEKSNKLKRP